MLQGNRFLIFFIFGWIAFLSSHLYSFDLEKPLHPVIKVRIAEKETTKILLKGKIYSFSVNSFKSPLSLNSKSSESCINVDGRDYIGNIILTVNKKGKITIVNEVSIEDYLPGVIEGEISPVWPEESLKAQAVVARTYAFKNLTKHQEEGFNLCNDTHCQVYKELSKNKQIQRAVEETKGQVLVFKGELAGAYFHSNCGGRTENVAEVWGKPDNSSSVYLRGVRCPYGRQDPGYFWRWEVDRKEIVQILNNSGFKIRPVKKILPSGRTGSRRIKELIIYSDQGKIVLAAYRFRLLCGPERLRSTIFKLRETGDKFIFTGQGWGHGVGLCQWGMRGLANRGYNYRKILNFYFPGTRLKRLEYQ